MDIQRLLRTYIHVNDPKRRNTSIKLALFVIALAAFSVFAYAQFIAGPSSPTGTDAGTPPQAGTGTGAEGHEHTCIDAADLTAWQAEHPEVEILTIEQVEGGRVCISYEAP